MGEQKKKKLNFFQRVNQSDTPIVIYIVLFGAIFLMWYFKDWNEDFCMNMVSELTGAAFTIFIIEFMLMNSKRKRWQNVSENVNYLISRSVFKIIDGLLIRVLNFKPLIKIKHVLDSCSLEFID